MTNTKSGLFRKSAVTILLCSLFFCSMIMGVSAQNIVTNGDFENGSTGWTDQFWGQVTMTHEPGAGRTITDAVQIESTIEPNDSYWYQDVSLTPGKKYILKGYIKGIDIASGYGANLGYYGSTVSSDSDGMPGTFDWTYAYTIFTADSGGEVRLRLGNWGAVSSGTALYDDIHLEAVQQLLIIVSKPLLNQELTAAIAEYQDDIIAQGWEAVYKTVSNISGDNPDWVCTTPAALKSHIEGYYNNGYDGVLFVGSYPQIPALFFHFKEDLMDSRDIGPSDLYYVTFGGAWEDNNSDGIYEYEDVNGNPLHDLSVYEPDMIFGRLTAKEVTESQGSTSIEKERNLVLGYFDRIHNYRVNGSALTSTMQQKALYYKDDEWAFKNTNHYEDCPVKDMLNFSPDVTVYMDNSLTCGDGYHDLLMEGFRFADIGHHSGQFSNWSTNANGDFEGQNYATGYSIADLETLSATDLKINHINLFACGEGRYADFYSETQETFTINNFGATYLFRNSHVLGVTAAAVSGVEIGGKIIYEKLNDERTIGEAVKACFPYWHNVLDSYHMHTHLLGDPLIVYPRLRERNNLGPKIYNDLKNLEAKQGETFTLVFDIVDPESDAVTLNFYNLPANAYKSGTNTLVWPVATNQVGKNYTITAEAVDAYGNACTEVFTIYASYFANGMMKRLPGTPFSGWTQSTPPITAEYDPYGLNPLQDHLWALSTDNSYGYVYQAVTVAQNTDYKLVYFTDNELSQNADEVCISIPELGLDIYDINEAEFCSQEYIFSSGAHSTLTFYLKSGKAGTPTTGNVWISGIKLVKLSATADPFAGETEVYLSDINWEYAYNEYSYVHRDEDVDFNPIVYNEEEYTKGLGVLAESEIRYHLDSKCAELILDVPNDGYKDYKIYADDALIYGDDYPEEDPVHLELDVTGVDKLTLQIVKNEATAYWNVVGFWLDAKVTVYQEPGLVILYKNCETNLTTGTLRPWFQVENTGDTVIDLEDVTIRYWYTKDSTTTQNYICDWAQVGAGNVAGNFVDISPVTGADNYFAVGFTSGAGSLDPDENSGDIQLRLYKNGWENYDQAGDYSFERYMTSFGDNPKVTAYLDGELIYGTEP